MEMVLKKRLQLFEDMCRGNGLRLTPQRLEIFKELVKSDDHPTAERLHQRLLKRLPTLSLDTVYRTLATFVDLGVAIRVETVESHAHFEAFFQDHHHVICRKCDKIIDFEWEIFDSADLPEQVKQWGSIERKDIVLYGICNDCLQK